MTARTVSFLVEQAGCESCAARVRAALEPLGEVAEIAVDADADLASVRLRGDSPPVASEIDAALARASHGSGHRYRVKAGSWRSASVTADDD